MSVEFKILETIIQSMPSLALAAMVYLIMLNNTKKLIELVENNTKVMSELTAEIKYLIKEQDNGK